MGLTDEQLLVKDTRGKNMLVSAAAGSGKTFVLVQRIISRILEENGIDVDEILVVTFTNAAAAEMKDRIRRAIDKAVLSEGADARIRAQATLIHSAHIRTIDSFCSWVVKNYFYEIDMDPAFRIGTTGEMKMLFDEVFSDLLSEYLDSGDADFKLLADAYIQGRKTDGLKDMVDALHRKATSFAWIEEWYDDALKLYEIDSVEALKDSEAIRQILVQTDLYVQAMVDSLQEIVNLYDAGSDSKDKDIFTNELGQLKGILSATSFDEKYAAVSGCDFSTRFGSKGTTLDEDSLAKAKALRDQYKKLVKDLISDYYSCDLEMILEDIVFVKKQATALIKFTRDFSNRFYEAKKKRNIYEFNDIEHMALEILRVKDSKDHEKRPVAIELSKHFKEVMVDEYQDSNELQEQILTAIASGNNYFTVGDVKQSIYAFRQASPKLFIEKLYSYPMGSDATNKASIRIDLDKNFRSRGQVLEFSNKVFAPLMQMDVGGVAYDNKAALKVGDETFQGEAPNYESEVIAIASNADSTKELGIKNGDELEALVVANKIKTLMAEDFQVSYKEGEGRGQRPVKLSDIVILMRAISGHADKYINVLKDHGIPAYVAEETGFFEREEIETVLSFLTVIDNPFNDIPLAAVLHSPMFNFSSERLAKIRTIAPKVSLYECMKLYNQAHPSKDIEGFFDMLNHFRDEAVDTPIHEIIIHVLEETGFGTYTKALTNGKMASANLDKLIDEAVSFESTSFKGLSRFVAYIESLKTYDEDLGLAKTVGENDDAVRIMSIHKSKGLEYPVVFVSGMGRGFMADKEAFQYDDKLGIALKYRNPVTRIAHDTPFYNLVKARVKEESRGEYLRILYVALTRAVDKLIITGTIPDNKTTSAVEKVESFKGGRGHLDYPSKMNATSGMELILRGLFASQSDFDVTIVDPAQIFVNEVEGNLVRQQAKEALQRIVDQAKADHDNPIANTLSFAYDGIKDSLYKSKYSVSEIKHQAMEDAFSFNADAAPAFIHNEDKSYIPMFMREATEASTADKTPAGALYGTAMHRFMECYDFTEDVEASFDEQLKYMHEVHSLSEDEFNRISVPELKKFMADDLASRMSAAALKGSLYKEKPFVFGSDAAALFEDKDSSDEMILVQGIIDVFFEEEDGIVLMDYKTDRVDDEAELVLRYKKQLQLYKDAIEHAYGAQVKEVLIYSFAFDKTINVEV